MLQGNYKILKIEKLFEKLVERRNKLFICNIDVRFFINSIWKFEESELVIGNIL